MLVSNVRKKLSTHSKIKNVFKDEDGAIDLASIMVGIIVIGLIGGVIAATVFAVIPWAQDNAAKQQLDSIHTSENAYFGMNSDPSITLLTGQTRNTFTDSAGLEKSNLLTDGPDFCVIPLNGGKDYQAYSKSGSGKVFTASNSQRQVTQVTGAITDGCSALSPVAPTPTGPTATPGYEIFRSWDFETGYSGWNASSYDTALGTLATGGNNNSRAIYFHVLPSGSTPSLVVGNVSLGTILPTTDNYKLTAWIKPSSNVTTTFNLKASNTYDINAGNVGTAGNLPQSTWTKVEWNFSGTGTQNIIFALRANSGTGNSSFIIDDVVLERKLP